MRIIQQPDSLSMSGNLKPYILETEELVTVELYRGAQEMSTMTFSPGEDGKVVVDFSEVLNDLLHYTHNETAEVWQQPHLSGTFNLMTEHSVLWHTFTCVGGGVSHLADTPSNFLAQNFLTWQPMEKEVTSNSPEFLTYFATQESKLVLSVLLASGQEMTFTYDNMPENTAWTYRMDYQTITSKVQGKIASYDAYVVDVATNQPLTYVQRYRLSDELSVDERWFGFTNSLGGYDTFRAKEIESSQENTHNLASNGERMVEYRTDIQHVHTVNTPPLSSSEEEWMLDFFASEGKKIYNCPGVREIILVDSSVKSYDVTASVSSYTFSYRFADDSAMLNVPRAAAPRVLNIVPEEGDAQPVVLAPRLASVPHLPLSPAVLIPAQDPYSQVFNPTTVGAIADYMTSPVSKFKGLFETLSKLNAAYPAASEGSWAVVGNTVPGPIYRYDCEQGGWNATGEVGGGANLTPIVMPTWCGDIHVSDMDSLNNPRRSSGLYLVHSDGMDTVSGMLVVIADPLRHGVHQLFYTRCVLVNGLFNTSHTDNHTYIYERAYHNSTSSVDPEMRDMWTPWLNRIPDTLADTTKRSLSMHLAGITTEQIDFRAASESLPSTPQLYYSTTSDCIGYKDRGLWITDWNVQNSQEDYTYYSDASHRPYEKIYIIGGIPYIYTNAKKMQRIITEDYLREILANTITSY